MSKVPQLVMTDDGMEWGRWAQERITYLEAQDKQKSQDILLLNKAIEGLRTLIASKL